MNDESLFTEHLQELRERVGYEDWLLESVYKLVENELFPDWPDAVVYHVGAIKPVITNHGRFNINLGDWRPGFLEAGAPMVFTASFKVLDMLFEWILERNGKVPGFRFANKLQQLQSTNLSYPEFLRSRPWLLERLQALYRCAEPLRGTIIHSRHFDANGGALRVAPSKNGMLCEEIQLSASDLRTFAQLCVSVLRYVHEDWVSNDHREKVLRWQLDSLVNLHNLESLGQSYPRHTRVRWYTHDPQVTTVDVERIRRDLREHNPQQDLTFDLRVIVLEESKSVVAYLIPYEALSVLHLNGDWACYVCDVPN